MTRRIAMWSGPRNLSTALMRAFSRRSDTEVVDEPLYACYLAATGLDHPMRAEVLASMPARVDEAVAAITVRPCAAAVQYQKHMAQHLLPTMDRGWLAGLTHAFLLRDPRRVVASYAARRGSPTPEDLGFHQLLELYERLEAAGERPPVILAEDILAAPRPALVALCEALDVDFQEAMLRWPQGPLPGEGVWAPHWYGALWRSTGFGAPTPAPERMPEPLEAVARACEPAFHRLYEARLPIADS
ncbi:MAG: hypothetical protein R3B72_47850 [Polyangiaceae bacterium]